MARMKRKFADRPTAKEKFISKKSSKPTKTKKVGAPDTKGGDRHPGTSSKSKKKVISSGVDRGLAKAVADRTADRATGKFSGMPASTTPSGFVDIGFGEGQIDPRLAAGVGTMALPSTVGTTGLVQGDPWVSTSGWTPDTGVGGTGISGIDTTVGDGTVGDGTGDGGVDTTTTEGKKEEEKKFFIKGVGMVDKRLNDYYQGLLKRMEHKEAIDRVKLKQMEDDWADKNLKTLKEVITEKGPFGLPVGPLGIIKGALQKPPYENEFLGSAGAANILNQLNKIKGRTDKETAQLKQDYVNRILAANKGAEEIFGQPAAAGTQINPSEFEQGLVEANQGNKNFDKNYYKTVGAYWDVNTPQTQGDQESMATAFQQGNLKMTKANTLAIQQAVDAKSRMNDAASRGLDSIGGEQPTDPIDTTDPDKPYGNLTFDVYGRPITNYDYTGGPEQLYLGGGWKKDDKYIGSPWGPNPHQNWGQIQPFKEGGIANFKPYGY
jgi:hypothetical protein